MEISSWLGWVGTWGGNRKMRQSRSDNCVQTVIAMALGISIEQVEDTAGSCGAMTVDETLALLNVLGIYCRPVAAALVADFWPVFYKRHGSRNLRGLGFAISKQADKPGHAFFIKGSEMYDPATGLSERMSENSLKQLDWLALLPEQPAGGVARGVSKKKKSAGKERGKRIIKNDLEAPGTA